MNYANFDCQLGESKSYSKRANQAHFNGLLIKRVNKSMYLLRHHRIRRLLSRFMAVEEGSIINSQPKIFLSLKKLIWELKRPKSKWSVTIN